MPSFAEQCPRAAALGVRGFLPIVSAAFVAFQVAAFGAGERLQFNRDIRPILSDNCFGCHGFDPKSRKAELRLDEPGSAFGSGESGEIAIVPGKPEASEVWKRIISAEKDEVMPPPKSHKKLGEKEKAILKRWIEEGAEYQRHWSFAAPLKAAPPPHGGAASAVDAFLLEKIRGAGFAMTREADREVLIRRVTYALTGLPPKVEEVDAFLADKAAGAYERVVDRLLGSAQFGEQMARHWLDVARYGDTHGLHLDNERSVWPYRDWVVNAFNRNLSFKTFTIEQLAGDLLPDATPEQLSATGFSRCNVSTNEAGSIGPELLFRYAVDRTTTTAQAWLGLTAGCAVCHDHKFDPITQKEFYQLYAFFNQAADPAMDGNALLSGPTVRLPTEEQKQRLALLETQVAEAEKGFREELKKLAYVDPADMPDSGGFKEMESVLIDDAFPAGANVVVQPQGEVEKWVTDREGPVSSGARSLRITGKGSAQAFYQTGAAPFEVPPDARVAFMLFLDPVEGPKSVMIQLHANGRWEHRAIWGDGEGIPWGRLGAASRFHVGELPPEGNWARLEVDAASIGLKAGDQITGIALTHGGGAAFFDQVSLLWRVDGGSDPERSFKAWLKINRGKENQAFPGQVNAILKKDAEPKGAELGDLKDFYLSQICLQTKAVLQPLQNQWKSLRAQRDSVDKSIPGSLVMRDLEGGSRRQSFVMERGEYNKPGEKVEAGVPSFLPPLPAGQVANRLGLAEWLMADENPLTARVYVNRLWQQIFGAGLVRTPGDFGSQGQPPTHLELLDWLAVDFRESGWDVKRMVRLLVTSEAFRQSSAAPAAMWSADPENRLLARGPRFRLDAEELRDGALAVAGLLDSKMGGKGVRPYQPPNVWEPVGFVGSNTRFYQQGSGSDLYRRSIYTFLKRTAPPPFMANFDAPSREQSCIRRERSNTPLQALQLMNDVQFFEAARVLAQRLLREAGETVEEKITMVYRTVLSRRPQPEEVSAVGEAFQKHLATYSKFPESACKLVSNGDSKPDPSLKMPELAAWTLVCNLVLNLDESLTQH